MTKTFSCPDPKDLPPTERPWITVPNGNPGEIPISVSDGCFRVAVLVDTKEFRKKLQELGEELKRPEEINEGSQRFWECEYCGTVNSLETLTCQAPACGHGATRKAMEKLITVEPKRRLPNPKRVVSGSGSIGEIRKVDLGVNSAPGFDTRAFEVWKRSL
jgi:hypothetical protein